MQAGFVGLGRMGRAMAGRLLGEGVDLVVWNRSADRAGDLQAERAASPAELIGRVPLVFLSLADSHAVEQVLTGPDGLLQGECGGKLIVDTTTNHYKAVTRFHEAASARGAKYLECPVAGSVKPAAQGSLMVLVSGTWDAFEQAQPYLAKIGRKSFFLGPPGLASKAKLINNMVLGSFMSTLAEATLLGEAIGLSREQALEVLATGAGSSRLLDGKREKLLREDYAPEFPSILMYRDLDYLQDLGEDLKRSIFTGRLARELFALVVSKEYDELDITAVYKTLREF